MYRTYDTVACFDIFQATLLLSHTTQFDATECWRSLLILKIYLMLQLYTVIRSCSWWKCFNHAYLLWYNSFPPWDVFLKPLLPTAKITWCTILRLQWCYTFFLCLYFSHVIRKHLLAWRNLFRTWWWHKQNISYSTTGPLKIKL